MFLLKFIYSKIAKKIWRNIQFLFDVTLYISSNNVGTSCHIFLAFSEGPPKNQALEGKNWTLGWVKNDPQKSDIISECSVTLETLEAVVMAGSAEEEVGTLLFSMASLDSSTSMIDLLWSSSVSWAVASLTLEVEGSTISSDLKKKPIKFCDQDQKDFGFLAKGQ